MRYQPLTERLKDSNSLVKQFLKQRFPRAASLTRKANLQLQSEDTINPGFKPKIYDLLATAIGYRIRYSFAITLGDQLDELAESVNAWFFSYYWGDYQKLFVKNATRIILRRFSAKEEPRRITVAVLQDRAFGTDQIALENHLNYLYRPGGTLSYEEAVGIAAFLNSTLVDRYFRITNGNTQVNATELRRLPLPPWERLAHIGERVAALEDGQDHDAIEQIIMEELGEDLVVGNGEDDLQLPLLKDSRIPEHMIHFDGEKLLNCTSNPNSDVAWALLSLRLASLRG